MNNKNYVDLKSKSAVSFSKETLNSENHYFLTEKRYDSTTGLALSDSKRGIDLFDYENQQLRRESEIVSLQAEVDALKEIIKDIKAL